MSAGTVHPIRPELETEPHTPGDRLRLAFIECRTYGHGWEEVPPPEFSGRAARWGFRMSLRCVRCGSHRHDVIGHHGELSVRTYDYADGYQDLSADEFEGRPSRNDFRLLLGDEKGYR